MKAVAIILAAGMGTRYGSPKQFVSVHNKPILAYTVEKFDGFMKVITVQNDFMPIAEGIAKDNNFDDFTFVAGGSTRQESVKNALEAACKYQMSDNVVITDANRPLISRENITKGLWLLENCDCVVSVCKATNTMCNFNNGYEVLPRGNMYELLMPQFFNFKKIYEAHVHTTKVDVTDDSQLLAESKVRLLSIPFWEGLKLTHFSDYKIFELLLKPNKENE